MGPVAQSEGHDAPGLIDELVPGVAAMADDVVVGCEDAVREPVVAQELPDILDRVQLGCPRRQRHEGDVGWHLQLGRDMPAGLIQENHGVGSGRDRLGDLGQMQAMASVVQRGSTRAAPLPWSGQIAPKM